MQAAELLALPPARRELVIRSCHPRRRSLLLDECLGQGSALRGWDHEAVVAHLELAVRLADAADSSRMQVRARFELGNAYRIVERYRDAAALFDEAAARLGADAGREDRLDLELYRVSHALAGDDWRSALFGLRPVVGVAEGRRAVRAYLQLVRSLTDAGELGGANQVLGHALRRAQQVDAPNLVVVGLSQQIRLLVELGRIDDAVLLFQESVPLYQAYCTPAELLKIDAIEAHLLGVAGYPASAARMLWGVAARILSTPGESVRTAVDAGIDAIGFAVRAGEPAEAVELAGTLRDAVLHRGVPPRLLRLLASVERQGGARLLPRLERAMERWKQAAFRGG